MDESLVPILRMFERLLVVSFGGMAIYLGYKLFYYLPQQKDHEGKIELPGMSIVLSRVGPGVFFLAFGAIILIHNLDKEIEHEQKSNDSISVTQVAETTQSFVGASDLSGNTSDTGIAQRRVAAIEHVGALNCLLKLVDEEMDKIPANLHIAHHEAKIALLKPVWNEQTWGNIAALAFGGDSIKNTNLKGVFNDVSISCQH